jgi:bifunctional enzyme CysN/CysC
VAELMMNTGLIFLAALISPFRAQREMAKPLKGADKFYQVFVDTPLETYEQHNPKGLYKKARSSQLPNMTGISNSYNRQQNSKIRINTTASHLNNSINHSIDI